MVYAKKGAELIDATIYEDLNYFRFNIDYLEIPLLVVFSMAPDSRVNPVIFAGPVPAAKITANADFGTVGGGFIGNDTDESVDNYDLGAAAGAGFEIAIGTHRLFVEGRYVHGLPNIIKGDSLNPKKNRSASVSLGFFF